MTIPARCWKFYQGSELQHIAPLPYVWLRPLDPDESSKLYPPAHNQNDAVQLAADEARWQELAPDGPLTYLSVRMRILNYPWQPTPTTEVYGVGSMVLLPPNPASHPPHFAICRPDEIPGRHVFLQGRGSVSALRMVLDMRARYAEGDRAGALEAMCFAHPDLPGSTIYYLLTAKDGEISNLTSDGFSLAGSVQL